MIATHIILNGIVFLTICFQNSVASSFACSAELPGLFPIFWLACIWCSAVDVSNPIHKSLLHSEMYDKTATDV